MEPNSILGAPLESGIAIEPDDSGEMASASIPMTPEAAELLRDGAVIDSEALSNEPEAQGWT